LLQYLYGNTWEVLAPAILNKVTWGRIHNSSFSLQLSNGTNKLEWFVTLGLNCLSRMSTVA
jgi:hypothetical protein